MKLSPTDLRKLLIALWVVLLSHRAFLPRGEGLDFKSSYNILVFVEVGITAFIFTVISILVGLRIRAITSTSGILGLWLYSAYIVISLAWSPYPAYGAFWAARLFSAVAIVTLYFYKVTPKEVYRFLDVTIFALVPYLVLPFVSLEVSLPQAADMRITGLWLHPSVGAIMSFAILIICVVMVVRDGWRRNWLWIPIALLSLGSGFLFGGKTGSLVGLMTIGVSLLTKPSLAVALRLSSLSGLAFIGLWLYGMEYGLIAHLNYYLEEVQFGTIEARFSLWNSALHLWMQSPWSLMFGHGYTSTRVNKIVTHDVGWITTHAHNSFLQSLVEVGIVGSLPLFWFISRFVASALRVIVSKESRDSRLIAWAFAVLHLIIGSIMDNVFGGLIYGPFYLLLAGGMSLLYLSRSKNKNDVSG